MRLGPDAARAQELREVACGSGAGRAKGRGRETNYGRQVPLRAYGWIVERRASGENCGGPIASGCRSATKGIPRKKKGTRRQR